MNDAQHDYASMWEDFADAKRKTYNELKFTPVNRVGLTNAVREEAIMRAIAKAKPRSVLDIGCASGRQVFRIAPFVDRIVGVDIAPSFIEESKKQNETLGFSHAEFAVADFDTLPKEQFDCVLCCEVLEHVVDLDFTIDCIDGVIAPGGYALITVPHYNADGTWWGRLMRMVGKRSFEPLEHFSAEEIVKHGDAHVREFSRKRLAGHFAERGYSAKQLYTVSHADGPMGDRIFTLFLHRLPFTRPIFMGLERLAQLLFPGLGRHVVLLAQKSA